MNEPCTCGPYGRCPPDCENRRKPARAEAERQDVLDTPLPCPVELPGMVIGKGVALRVLVDAAHRWKSRLDDIERERMAEPEKCPRCGASVGLLGRCAHDECPCPVAFIKEIKE